MTAHGSNELLSAVAAKDLCIGCGSCVNLCPYFKSYKGAIARLFPCTVEEGRCYSYCPKVDVDLDKLSQAHFGRSYEAEPLGVYQSIYAANAGPAAPRGRFQSGGSVSALMTFALVESRIEAAVLTDRMGIQPVPRTIVNADGVVRCATSKYAAAPTLAEVNAALNQGHSALGVVATPCQSLALAQMRTCSVEGHDVSGKIKIVIALFCTWALDYKKLEAFLARRVATDAIEKIEIPPPPAQAMLVETEHDTLEIPLAEVREAIPNSCAFCIDMTGEFADISIGVLEGAPDKNTLIVRSDIGKALVDRATKEGYLEVEPYPDEALKHLSWAAQGKKQRALALLREKDLLGFNDEVNPAALRMRQEVVEKIVLPESCIRGTTP